jgi:uncharacterized membrane protein
MMWNDYGFHEGWGGMGFGMILFWILLVVALVVLFSRRNRVRPSARDLLDESEGVFPVGKRSRSSLFVSRARRIDAAWVAPRQGDATPPWRQTGLSPQGCDHETPPPRCIRCQGSHPWPPHAPCCVASWSQRDPLAYREHALARGEIDRDEYEQKRADLDHRG